MGSRAGCLRCGPDGQTWTWGPEDAGQRVRGSALDFCLRVTQRRPADHVPGLRGEAGGQWWGMVMPAARRLDSIRAFRRAMDGAWSSPWWLIRS
ncbi:hypothetical protein ACIBEJ_29590 [Nonomuraea sp. NPDC050790]|uniref:hypothetical protein n=1 Tax=Nonomuraea sp. NPDC050790 TaxID=3364371 RepID=UPI0037B9FF4C